MVRSTEVQCQQDSLRDSFLGCKNWAEELLTHGELPVLLAAVCYENCMQLVRVLQKSHAAGGCPGKHPEPES